MKRLQFVWWWRCRWDFGFRWAYDMDPGIATVYRWFLWLGPLEVRRWR